MTQSPAYHKRAQRAQQQRAQQAQGNAPATTSKGTSPTTCCGTDGISAVACLRTPTG
jgi:hypothetical protein